MKNDEEEVLSGFDAVIEAYKRDVDRTLIRENLRLPVAQRMERFEQNMRTLYKLREAGQRMREKRVAAKED
jgi:hypothetical protein